MAVLDKNGTEYLWNKAKEKFAAKDDVPKIPEGVVLYTEQSLTDSQKAQARGNIGAVKSWDELEDKPFGKTVAPTYVYTFTGQEEVIETTYGFNLVYIANASLEWVKGIVDATVYDKQTEETISVAQMVGVESLSMQEISSDETFIMLGDNVFGLQFIYVFVPNVDIDGMFFQNAGVYFMDTLDGMVGDDVFDYSSLSSSVMCEFATVKYLDEECLKMLQGGKIKKAYLRDVCWGDILDKPFYREDSYEELLPRTTVSLGTTAEASTNSAYIYSDITIEDGDEVIVTLSTQEWHCVAKKVGNAIYIGDLSLLLNHVSSSEVFCIRIVPGSGKILLKYTEPSNITGFAVSIKANKGTAKKIPRNVIETEWTPSKVMAAFRIKTLSLNPTTYNGLTTSTFNVIDNTKIRVKDVREWERAEIIFNDDVYEYEKKDFKCDENYLYIGNASLYSSDFENTGEPIAYKVGLKDYHFSDKINYTGEANHALTVYRTIYNQMPEEYLPESVSGVTIRSSTEGSTKKFKLTVDDSGTITATEVV